MKKRITIIMFLFILIAGMIPKSVSATTSNVSPGGTKTLSGISEGQNRGQSEIPSTPKAGDKPGNPSVNPGNPKPGTPGGSTTTKEKVPGTISKPWIMYSSTPYNSQQLSYKLKKQAESAGKGSTIIFEKPTIEVSEGETTTYIPSDYPGKPPIPFYFKTYRSTIKIYTEEKITVKTTKKDSYYNWKMEGPETFTKDSSSYSTTITFKIPGKYLVTFTPYEEITTTKSGKLTAYSYESWPKESGKKSTTIQNISKNLNNEVTTKVEADTSRIQTWTIIVTAADIEDPVPIITPTPPNPDPKPNPNPNPNPGDSDVEDADLDVTIVE